MTAPSFASLLELLFPEPLAPLEKTEAILPLLLPGKVKMVVLERPCPYYIHFTSERKTAQAGLSFFLSHLPDLNRGPLLYESTALPAELRWHLPEGRIMEDTCKAVRVGFEPTVPFQVHRISSAAPSTTQPPHRFAHVRRMRPTSRLSPAL